MEIWFLNMAIDEGEVSQYIIWKVVWNSGIFVMGGSPYDMISVIQSIMIYE